MLFSFTDRRFAGRIAVLVPLLLLFLSMARVALAQDQLEPASNSQIVGILFPSGGFRSTNATENARFLRALDDVAEKAGGSVARVEVVIWSGGDAPKRAMPGLLEAEGFRYVAEPPVTVDGSKMTLFAAAGPNKAGLLGMWVEQEGTILLAWGPLSAATAAGGEAPAPAETPAPDTGGGPSAPAKLPATALTSSDTITISVAPSVFTVNVMKSAMPPIPKFPEVKKKPGTIRGYVRDTKGKPLAKAKIGVRSTAVGGFYSGTDGVTDEKGFYEISVPFGVAQLYCAGYSVDYGEGRAALGLHPADGEIESLASNVGAVENFVLLPYGIADRDAIQQDAKYLNNYYGGSIILSYSVDDDSRFPSKTGLPVNSEIELTLKPDKAMIDGTPARTIVIRKQVGNGIPNQLYINNIPVTTYQVQARLTGGGKLKMRETGPNSAKMFGIDPKEAAGQAALLLRPANAKPESALPAKGNWDQIVLTLERM